MTARALALLRFDFVLGGSDGAVGERLRDRLGDPVESTSWRDAGGAEREALTFEADGPDRLGLPGEFGSVTVRVRNDTEAVTEVLTVAVIDERRLAADEPGASNDSGYARIRDWERQLGAVRSLLPGDARGPETTVFWLEPPSTPGGPASRPVDAADVERSLATDEAPGPLDPFGARSRSRPVVVDGETLLIPRDTRQPWGTLLAVDLAGHLRTATASGGRQLRGPWAALSTLYAIHYWCRARGDELAAFEERLDDAAAALPGVGDAVDPVVYDRSAAAIHDLQEDHRAFDAQVEEESAVLRRRLEDCWARLYGRDRGARADDGTAGLGGDSELLAAYLEQLEYELERVRASSDRNAAQLDALSAMLQGRLSIVATRETVELQRRLGDRVAGRLGQGDWLRWFAAAVGALVVILTADALMTGGLEAFVDRLFEAGLAAFTTQVVAGMLLLVIAIATVVYLRRSDDPGR